MIEFTLIHQDKYVMIQAFAPTCNFKSTPSLSIDKSDIILLITCRTDGKKTKTNESISLNVYKPWAM